MGLKFGYDYWNNMETPSIVICRADKSKIGTLVCRKIQLKYNNEIPELSFEVPRYYDELENEYYNYVLELQYVYFENIGYFQITDISTEIEDYDVEYKKITAQSAEVELGQKYLNTFIINEGTDGSIDGVCLVNETDVEHSLMHLVLEKLPGWGIGEIYPQSLKDEKRSFDVDSTDVYAFLTGDVAEAFECVFNFDTENNLINIFGEEEISKNTDIVVSFKNLLKNATIEPDVDKIKTCVTLVGDDDLTVRELNLGNDRIYNFDYFLTEEYMENDLIDAVENYKVGYNYAAEQYTELIQRYQENILIKALYNKELFPMKYKNNSETVGHVHIADQPFENIETDNYDQLKSYWEWYKYCYDLTDNTDPDYIISDIPEYPSGYTYYKKCDDYIAELKTKVPGIDTNLTNAILAQLKSVKDEDLSNTEIDTVWYRYKDFIRYNLTELKTMKTSLELQQSTALEGGYGTFESGAYNSVDNAKKQKQRDYYINYYPIVIALGDLDRAINIRQSQVDSIQEDQNHVKYGFDYAYKKTFSDAETYIAYKTFTPDTSAADYEPVEPYLELEITSILVDMNKDLDLSKDAVYNGVVDEIKTKIGTNAYDALVLSCSRNSKDFRTMITTLFANSHDCMVYWQKYADIEKYFTSKQWVTLSRFIREDTLSDSNYLVTDAMTAEEQLEMQRAFLEHGQKELQRVSQPEFSFKLSMANLFNIAEYIPESVDFDIYNYIRVLIRDDYWIKVKILSFSLDFEDKSSFSAEFGSIYKMRGTTIWDTVADAVSTSNSAATTVSFNKFQWNETTSDTYGIMEMLDNGLISANQSLSNSSATMKVEDRGLFMTDNNNPNRQVAMTGSSIVFTDDNWKTAKTALGYNTYLNESGNAETGYGLMAEYVISGYVYGSKIVGNSIRGGSITGASFNNGNGTFSVNENGVLSASSGTVGGWHLGSRTLYSDNSTIVLNANGSITTASGKFTVGTDGKLSASEANISGAITASSGTIGGWGVDGTHIWKNSVSLGADGTISCGDNWAIRNNGEAYFSSVTINGNSRITGGTITTGATIDGRTWTGDWGGSIFGNNYIPDLSSKTFSGCNIKTSISISGGSGALSITDGYATVSGSAARIKAGSSVVSATSTGCYAVGVGGFQVNGKLTVTGDKQRIVQTDSYGVVGLCAYESPTPMFGDFGFGYIDDTGVCYIPIDPILYETIEKDGYFYVFLQKCGNGDLYYAESESTIDMFVVRGTPGLKFVWESKYIQHLDKNVRFRFDQLKDTAIYDEYDYEYFSGKYIDDLQGEFDYGI